MLKVYKSVCETCAQLQELTVDTAEKGTWFNLINPTPAELEIVAEATHVPMDFLKAALDEEERSRTEIEELHFGYYEYSGGTGKRYVRYAASGHDCDQGLCYNRLPGEQ